HCVNPHGNHTDRQRNSGSVENTSEDVATFAVGSEPVFPTRVSNYRGEVDVAIGELERWKQGTHAIYRRKAHVIHVGLTEPKQEDHREKHDIEGRGDQNETEPKCCVDPWIGVRARTLDYKP